MEGAGPCSLPLVDGHLEPGKEAGEKGLGAQPGRSRGETKQGGVERRGVNMRVGALIGVEGEKELVGGIGKAIPFDVQAD